MARLLPAPHVAHSQPLAASWNGCRRMEPEKGPAQQWEKLVQQWQGRAVVGGKQFLPAKSFLSRLLAMGCPYLFWGEERTGGIGQEIEPLVVSFNLKASLCQVSHLKSGCSASVSLHAREYSRAAPLMLQPGGSSLGSCKHEGLPISLHWSQHKSARDGQSVGLTLVGYHYKWWWVVWAPQRQPLCQHTGGAVAAGGLRSGELRVLLWEHRHRQGETTFIDRGIRKVCAPQPA